MGNYGRLLKLSIFIAFSLLGLLAHSEETYLQINGASLHSKSGYNGFNPGIGLEREISENWNVAAGWFYNSNYRGSAYLYGRYSFLRSGDWDLGVGIGGATGYNKWAVRPMAFPEVCYRYLCLIALPQIEGTNTSLLAVHARIPL